MDEIAKNLLLFSAVFGGPLLVIFLLRALAGLKIMWDAPWRRGSEPFTKMDGFANFAISIAMAVFAVVVILNLVEELG